MRDPHAVALASAARAIEQALGVVRPEQAWVVGGQPLHGTQPVSNTAAPVAVDHTGTVQKHLDPAAVDAGGTNHDGFKQAA